MSSKMSKVFAEADKRGKGLIRSQIFNLLGLFIILALFIARFSKVTTTDMTIGEFLGRLALIFFFITSMYVNYYNFGKQRGKSDDTFLSAKNAFSDVANSIVEQKLVHGLQKFCIDFAEKELSDRRRRLLFNINMDYDYYAEHYLHRTSASIMWDKSLNRVQRRFVLRANRQRAAVLTIEMLLNERGTSKKFDLGKTEARKTGVDILSRLGRSVVTAWFFGYYSLQLLSGFDMAVLGEFIIQCVSLILAGISGYVAGYNSIIGNLKNRYQLRHDLLAMYVEECDMPSA